jgi:hypothetical protein
MECNNIIIAESEIRSSAVYLLTAGCALHVRYVSIAYRLYLQ